MKDKKGTGLSRDKNLRVNKNAGYKFVKKDKSVNKRAGLHDKKKNIAEGERRVVRCKPLALKHKRRMRKAAVALAAICVGAVSYVGMGFLFKPDGLFVEDLGNYTVKAQRIGDNSVPAGGGKVYYFPEDGSLPTDHTLIENVAYLNYVLNDEQTHWSSYMESTVYTVMQQHVYTHKKSYKDEATGEYSFVSADMAVGASNTARQFCVTEEEVIWREAAGSISIENMDDTEWNESTYYGNTIAEFRSYRGLPANEFSVYILDENTVKNANDTTVKDNGDGTYSMTLDLKVHQSGLDSAVHYYKQQMYVTGGLYAWPTFDYTRVTYNFTADWQLLSFTINDSYSAKMGVIAASCTSESTTTFNYDEEGAVNTYRKDSFGVHEGGNYIRYSPFGNEKTLDAATCLANAFGSVLEEGATFKIDMNLAGRDLSGAVYVGLSDGSISDLRVALGELKVFLGNDDGKNMLFLAAGKDKFKLCTDGLFGSGNAETQPAEEGGADALAGLLDTNDLMKQLFAGEFDLQEKSATLKSKLSLFGLEIPIEFAFKVNGLDASLDYVYTSFSLNGSPVKARLEFGTEADIPAAPAENEKPQYKDILNGGLTLNLKLGLDNLTLNGAAEIKLADGKFTGVNACLGDYRAYYSAENGLVLIDLGGYKYKLDTSKLSDGGSGASALSEEVTATEEGSVLQQLIGFIVGGISTDGNGLNFNGALAADNSFNVLGTALKLAVDVNLRGYLGVNAKIDIGGKTAFAEVTVADNNSVIPAAGDVNDYKDILNEGITLGVSLALDGLKLDGVVDIAMNKGALSQVSANLGDITVYYTATDNTIYYADASGNKYKISLGATAGATSRSGEVSGLPVDLDIKSLINQIISNLSAADGSISTGANINIFEQALTVAANISLNDGLKVSVNAEVLGKKVAATVYLTENTLPALNPAEYKDILNGGVSFDVTLKLDGLDLSGSVYIGLTEGALTAVRANLSNAGGDIAVYFDSTEDMLYLKAGEGVKVKLPASVFGVNTQQSGGLLDGIDLKEILSQLINNLTFGERSVSSSVSLDIKDFAKVNVGATVSLKGGVGADLTVDILNKDLSLKAGLSKAETPELTAEQKAEYADVLNEGFNVNGNLQITVGETVLNLAINKLAVSLKQTENGALDFGFALDTRLTAGDVYVDLYISYLNGVATVVYGDAENYFGATLDISGGDLGKLEEALVSVYNRICAVLDEIITNNPLKPTDKAGLESNLTIDNLNKILSKLGVAISLEQGGANVLEMLGIPQTDGKLDIKELINGLTIYSSEDSIFGVTLGNISVQLKNKSLSASVDLEIANSSTRLYLENLSLGVYSAPACPDVQLLTADDFAEMLDYVAAAAELLVEDEYSLSANVDVYENDAVAYNVGILFEYVKGEKFPVQVTVPETDADGNKTGLSISIADDMYWHLGVALNNAAADKDDLYLDVYILDANPAVENGKTTNGEVTKGDGLDVYVSVSKYTEYLPDGSKNTNYAPLKVYAPVNEILTVLAAGVALLDIQNIDVSEESAAIQSVINKIGTLLDDALVKAKLPLTNSQFSSLGASLLPQIIGTDVSTLLKDILKTLSQPVAGEGGTANGENGTGENVGEPTVKPEPKPAHYINNIGWDTTADGDKALRIVLNSGAIYGDGFENLTFEAYKNYSYGTALADVEAGEAAPYEKSYITGAAVKNIYFGGNKKLDLGLKVVREVNEYNSFDGYYDFSGIDTLLKAAANSATHPRSQATELDKQIYGDKLTEYLLNRYYYLEGKIDLHIPVFNNDYQIGLAAAVYIDKNNEVGVNAVLDIPAIQEVMQVVTNGDTHTELTIKNGMVYMKRVQSSYWKVTAGVFYSNEKYETPITVYRAMPMSEFTANMLDNIIFLLNFGPVITDNIGNNNNTQEQPAEKDVRDFGAQIGTYLKSFVTTYTDNSASWALTINGSCIDFGTSAIGLNDIIIKLNADTRYDELTDSFAYALNGLNLETGLKVIGVLEIGVKGNITYCNPQQVMNDGYVDNTPDLSPMWEQLFGCDSKTLATAASGLKEGTEYTPEVIAANELWNEVIASLNTNKKYLEINSTASTGVDLGEVKYVLDGKACDADGKELAEGETSGEYVLYSAEKILTKYAVPHLQERGGYEIKSELNLATLTYTESYAAKTYNINIETAHEISGAGATQAYTYGSDLDLSAYIGKTTQDGELLYKLVSFELNGTEYNSVIPAAALQKIYGEEVTITAVWTEVYTVSLEFTGLPQELAAEALNYANTNAGFSDGKLYYEKDGAAITLNALANVTGYDFAGYTLNGAPVTEIAGLTSNVTLTATYKDVRILATFTSDVAFTYNGQTATAKDGKFVIETYMYRESCELAAAENAEMEFTGWWYNDNGKWRNVSSVAEFVVEGEASSVELEALWIKVDISGEGYRSKFKSSIIWTKYSYVHVGTVHYELIGNAEMLEQIEVSTNYYVHSFYDGKSYTKDFYAKPGGNTTEYTNYEIEFDTDGYSTDTGTSKERPTNWYIVAEFTLNVNGESYVHKTQGEKGNYIDK